MTVVVFEMTLETGKGAKQTLLPPPSARLLLPCPPLSSPPHPPLLRCSLFPLPSPQETQLLEFFCRGGLQGVACELKYMSKNGLCHHLGSKTTLLTLEILLLLGQGGHSLTSGLLVSRADFIWTLRAAHWWGPGKFCFCL